MDADPAANAGYMIAAYVVTAVILVGYALALWRRFIRAKSE
jgi:hypothetical protein